MLFNTSVYSRIDRTAPMASGPSVPVEGERWVLR
jgi:hypothetical protein